MKNLIYFLVLLISFIGCSKNSENQPSENGERIEGLAVIETNDPTLPFLINDAETHTELIAKSADGDGRITSIIIGKNENEYAEFILNEDNLPSKIVTDDVILVFDNYANQSVDLAVINSVGEIDVHRTIEIGNIQSTVVEIRTLDDLREVINIMGKLHDIVGCASVVTGNLGGIMSCGTLLVDKLIALGYADDYPILNSAKEFFSIYGLVGCVADPDDCLGTILSLLERVVEKFDDRLDEWSEEISLAEGVLKGGDGDIQITLTWDNDADLDLYVTDPDGETIYYSNSSSSSGGYLDLDDINGYGPENVFYETAYPGVYSISVDYYSGSSNANFLVRVSQFGYTKTYSGYIGTDQTVSLLSFTAGQPLPLKETGLTVENNFYQPEKTVR